MDDFHYHLTIDYNVARAIILTRGDKTETAGRLHPLCLLYTKGLVMLPVRRRSSVDKLKPEAPKLLPET